MNYSSFRIEPGYTPGEFLLNQTYYRPELKGAYFIKPGNKITSRWNLLLVFPQCIQLFDRPTLSTEISIYTV